MVELIACLSAGEGTWKHVDRLINEQEWDNVFLIADEFAKDFKTKKKIELISINSNKFLSEMADEIKNRLKGRIKGIDVALNLISGSGKEHMAILAALLKLGVGIRFVALTKEGIKEI